MAGNPISGSNTADVTFLEMVTRTVQDGVSPTSCYNGTRDSYISEAQLPNGADPGRETLLLVDGSDPSPYDKASVLKWNLTGARLPANIVVQSAAIIIDVVNETSGPYELFGLKRAWDEYQVTWDDAANGSPWQIPGAFGANDRDPTEIGILGNTPVGKKTIDLNAAGVALVQSWLDNPSGNHGLIIANSSTSNGLDFSSREAGPADRPALRITYRVSGGGSGDTESPTWPSGGASLQQDAVTSSTVSLSWNAASDNVGVTGYIVDRDGQQFNVTDGSTNFTDVGLTSDRDYTYHVVAIDAAGNQSVASASLVVHTLPAAPNEAHVDDIAMAIKSASKRRAYAEASVTIRDQNGSPVDGAAVDVVWSGLVSGTQTLNTDSAGIAVFSSDIVDRNVTGRFQLQVTDVRPTSGIYDETDNVEDTGCIERTTAGSTNSVDCTYVPPMPPPSDVLVTIDPTLVLTGKGKNWQATATVTVRSADDNQLLANATVTGRWTVSGAGTDLGTTEGASDSNGVAQLISPSTKLANGEQLCLVVENVAAAGASYPKNTGPVCISP